MAVIWEYGFFFTINRMSGSSILSNPLESIGLLFLIVALIIGIFTLKEIYKKYKKTEDINTLTFFLAGVSLFLSTTFLNISILCYSYFGLLDLGNIMEISATVCTGFTGSLIDIFAIRFTYPTRVKIFSILASVGALIYVGISSWAIIQGIPFSYFINFNNFRINFDQTFHPIIALIIYCVLIPILTIPPILFFFFGTKIRENDRARSNLSLWFGVGLSIASITIFNEIAPVFWGELANPLRILSPIWVIIIYVCFTMPDWFKHRIGWPD